jgi:hypothetical protein
MRETDHLIDLGVNRKLILKWIFKKWYAGHELDYLAQDRDRWRALVNSVMNLQFS